MPRVKKGKIIPNGVSLEKHENEKSLYFGTRLSGGGETVGKYHI